VSLDDWQGQRSDELITLAFGTKITHACTSVQDAPSLQPA